MARGRKTYSVEQRQLLERAEMKCSVTTQEKAELNAWLRRQAEDKMERLYEERGVALRAALSAGVTKSDLMNALGSKNWYTFQEALGFGAELEQAEDAIAEAREAAQPFEVVETLAWNDVPYMKENIAKGHGGMAGDGWSRLVVSRTDPSVKGWVTVAIRGDRRWYGFAEDRYANGCWMEGRAAFKIRDEARSPGSWEELAERQSGAVADLVRWVGEHFTE